MQKLYILLELFLDSVSNNMLDGLPLVQKINHLMDLIRGANFPDKAMHRMTPTESDELNRKVHELL